jgi:hypothetical protein
MRWLARTSLSIGLLLPLFSVTALAHGGPHKRAERTEIRELAHVPGAAMEVETRNGSIEVRADPSIDRAVLTAEVEVQARSARDAEQDLGRVEVVFERGANGTLRAEVVIPKDIEGGGSLSLRVPDASDTVVRTANGSVSVSGLSGRLDATTANGAVEVRHHGGQVEARSSNGSITLEDISGEVEARTSNGGIQARRVGGPFQGATSNGSIDVELRPDAVGPVHLDTSMGAIRLEVGPGFMGRVDMDTSFGTIHADDRGDRIRKMWVEDDRGWILVGEEGPTSTLGTSFGTITVTVGG